MWCPEPAASSSAIGGVSLAAMNGTRLTELESDRISKLGNMRYQDGILPISCGLDLWKTIQDARIDYVILARFMKHTSHNDDHKITNERLVTSRWPF